MNDQEKMRSRWVAVCLVLSLAPALAEQPSRSKAADIDRITHLPLFGPPPTPQWSGYLNATEGCDTAVNGNDCQLHYWLALHDGYETDEIFTRTTKPLVLWLNGGPGASSILGFLLELGPLLINATGGLMRNPYAWTRVANVLVLESPVGVGYSYCANQYYDATSSSSSSSCYNTDRYTAWAARAALQDFFEKFRFLFDVSTTDFYIAGESYAGVYIPTLAREIIQFNRNASTSSIIPLKGILVGDPCTDNNAQSQARNPLWYSHKNGLVDDSVYETLTNQCDVSVVVQEQDEGGHVDESFRLQLNTEGMKNQALIDTCRLAMRKFLLSSSRGTDNKWDFRYIDHYSLYGIIDTRAEELTEQYMNRPDVRSALHIPDWLGEWKKHAPLPFHYEKEFAACNQNKHAETAPSMIDVYREICPQLDRTWIFNGDSDPCVSYEGTRTAVRRIGFRELDGGSYRPWFYNETATSQSVLQEKVTTFGPDLVETELGAQWGGHVTHYEHNLAFLTFHGSGHMVPMIRPIAALHMFTIFLQPSLMIAPLLVSNATLESMEPSDFDLFLNQWIKEAKDFGKDGDEIVSVN